MTETTKNRPTDHPSKQNPKPSPAGPHDKPELTDEHKTPGTGMLPDNDDKEIEGPTG